MRSNMLYYTQKGVVFYILGIYFLEPVARN